ncbi:MAG: hypothetical protein CBB71_12485 [Rhodopirellula sp. TMED11]|nr:MAG: hypothetical protein CBB71_12485 [Rhodopirellula sp. TMED11]
MDRVWFNDGRQSHTDWADADREAWRTSITVSVGREAVHCLGRAMLVDQANDPTESSGISAAKTPTISFQLAN